MKLPKFSSFLSVISGFILLAIYFCIAMSFQPVFAQADNSTGSSSTDNAGDSENSDSEAPGDLNDEYPTVDSGYEVDNESEANDDSDPEADGVSDIFEIDYYVGTQSVFNDSIPIYVHIVPKLDSSKAEINWDLPHGLTTKDPLKQWFSMEDGGEKTFKIVVSPEDPGSYEIVANLTAWRYDSNYVDSVTIEFDIDQDLHITPLTSEYQRNQILYVGGIIVLIVLSGVGLIFLIKFLFSKYKSWMATD
ncbi:hypothetical protein JW887_05860 [Candidatus Dojkabacteria bacterium]|nr:hypothetical protein [Candidatus Dojkabacteria bacterium]